MPECIVQCATQCPVEAPCMATLAAVERQGRKRCGRATVAPAAAVHARTVAAAVVPAKPRVDRVAYAAQPESLLARSAGFGLGVGQHARTDGDEQHYWLRRVVNSERGERRVVGKRHVQVLGSSDVNDTSTAAAAPSPRSGGKATEPKPLPRGASKLASCSAVDVTSETPICTRPASTFVAASPTRDSFSMRWPSPPSESRRPPYNAVDLGAWEVLLAAAAVASVSLPAPVVSVSCRSMAVKSEEQVRTSVVLVPVLIGSEIPSDELTTAPTNLDACVAAASDTWSTTSTTASTADAVWPTAEAVTAPAAAALLTSSSTFSRIWTACCALIVPVPSASRAFRLSTRAALACVVACGSPLCSASRARSSTVSITAALMLGKGSTVALAVAVADAPSRSWTVTTSRGAAQWFDHGNRAVGVGAAAAGEAERVAEWQVVGIVGPVGGAQSKGAVELVPSGRHHLEGAPTRWHVHQDSLLCKRGVRARCRLVRRGEGEGVAAGPAGASAW
eukprot:scaffold12162_cov61-Phaeocystis_antarctica.AAC.4